MTLPAYSFKTSTITDVIIDKSGGKKTEINLKSQGSFKYYIHAKGNELIIDLKGANFNSGVINTVDKDKLDNDNIKSVSLENIDKDLSRIIFDLKEIKDFKFVVVAEKGDPAPYGFGNALNDKIKRDKKTPQKEISKSKQSDDLNAQIYSSPEYSNVQAPLSVVREEDEKASISFENTENIDLIIPESFNSNNRRKPDTKYAIRLNEESIQLPENYFNEAYNYEEPSQKEPENIVEKYNVSVETRPPEPEYKPIPADELLKRLNSDNVEMPRLVKEPEKENSDNVNSTNKLVIEGKDRNNSIISSVKDMPKGQFVSGQLKNYEQMAPDGSKIIEITNTVENKSAPNHYFEYSGSLLKPREINLLPLGLAEQFEIQTKSKKTNLNALAPKPTYTSDGSLALTIISADGIENKVAAKKPVKNVYNNNTSTVNIDDKRIIEINQKDDDLKVEFKRLILKAKELYNRNQITEAEKIYKKAILLMPDQPWGYITLAGFYEVQKRHNDAINAYNKALNLLPEKAEIMYNLAINYYKTGEFTQATDYLHRVISTAPDFTLAYYNLGTIYYKMKDYEKAIDYLERSIRLNPVLTDAHFNAGLAYASENKTPDALNHFEKCLSVDPDDKECSIMLSRLK